MSDAAYRAFAIDLLDHVTSNGCPCDTCCRLRGVRLLDIVDGGERAKFIAQVNDAVEIARLASERDEARRELEGMRTEAAKRTRIFADVRAELDAAQAELKRRRECHHLERTPEGTQIAYYFRGEFILNGDPYEEHNCDEMGCSSVSHVVKRVSDTALARLAAAERVVEAARNEACDDASNPHSGERPDPVCPVCVALAAYDTAKRGEGE